MGRKVIFGSNEDSDLSTRQVFRGGLGNIGAFNGDMIEFINFEGNDYLISKVAMASPNMEELEGKYDVREVSVYRYPGGSDYNFFSTNKPSKVDEMLSKLLNSNDCASKIDAGVSVIDILNSYGFDTSKSDISKYVAVPSLYSTNNVLVTSVNDDLFNEVVENYINKTRRGR